MNEALIAARTELVNTFGRIAISIVAVVLFVAVQVLAMRTTGPLNESAATGMGQVANAFALVVGYWIGSSSGSTSKEARAAALQAAQLPPAGGGTTVTSTSTTATTTPAEPAKEGVSPPKA